MTGAPPSVEPLSLTAAVERSRIHQGLEPRVADRAVLRQVASLLLAQRDMDRGVTV
jgi:hypothetical protein